MSTAKDKRSLVPVHYELKRMKEILRALCAELNLAVIYGGDNRKDNAVLFRTYKSRPWKSYRKVSADIKNALHEIGFQNVFLMSDDMVLLDHLKSREIHMAWLNTGGMQGQNSIAHAPTFLEQLGISYIGHDPLIYSIMDHKITFKWLLESFGFATPKYYVWGPPTNVRRIEPNDKAFFKRFQNKTGPWVVKPARGRGSNLVFLVHSVAEINDAISRIYSQTYDRVLIEEYLPGREFCVSVGPQVMFQDGDFQRIPYPFAFSFLERLFAPDERIFTSLDEKPIDGKRAKSIFDRGHGDLVIQLSKIGHQLYRKLNLNYLIRIDLREDENGVLNVLEVNPKPDLKQPDLDSSSLVAMGLEGHKMTYQDLITSLLAAHLDNLFTFVPPLVSPILGLLKNEGMQIGLRPPISQS